MNPGVLNSWVENLYSGPGKWKQLCRVMIDLVFVVDGHVNRLKSLFVHKMQDTRGHAPIVEVLEAAGVYVREKVKVRGSEASTTSTTSKVVDICNSAMSTPEALAISLPKLASIATTIRSTTTSTSSDGDDTNSGLATPVWVVEPPTPVIADKVEWMVHRTESLTRIKQKKEARRRGFSMLV